MKIQPWFRGHLCIVFSLSDIISIHSRNKMWWYHLSYSLSRATSNPSRKDASPNQWSTNTFSQSRAYLLCIRFESLHPQMRKYHPRRWKLIVRSVSGKCFIDSKVVYEYIKPPSTAPGLLREETDYWHKGTMVIACFFRSFFGLPQVNKDCGNDITPITQSPMS